MNKEEFLKELRSHLRGLSQEDINERISFYSEMIDDRIDDGLTEEAAVADIGTVDEVIYELAQEVPLGKLVKEKIKPKRELKVWEIILICLLFPIWFPIALLVIFIAFFLYILFWVGVIVSYAIEIALIMSSIAGVVVFFAYLFSGTFNILPLAIAMLSGGAAVLMFFGCYWATRGTIKLHQKVFTLLKTRFIKKGDKK